MAPPVQSVQSSGQAPKKVWVKTKPESKRPPLRDIMAAVRKNYVQKGWDTTALDELAVWLQEGNGEADLKVGELQGRAVEDPNSAEKLRVFKEVANALIAQQCDPKKNGSDRPKRPPLRDIMAAVRQKYVQKGWDTTALDELAVWLQEGNGEADLKVGELQGRAVEDPHSAEKLKVFKEVANALIAQQCGYELRSPAGSKKGKKEITIGTYLNDYLRGTDTKIGVGHSSIPHQDEIPYYLRQLTPPTFTINLSFGDRGNVDPTDDYFTIIGKDKDNPLAGNPVDWLQLMAHVHGMYGLGLGFLSKDELDDKVMHRGGFGAGVNVRFHPWDKKLFFGPSFDYSLYHNKAPYPTQDFPNGTSHQFTPGFELGSNWNTEHITTSVLAQLEYTDIQYAEETFPYTFTDTDKLALWVGIPFKLGFSKTKDKDVKTSWLPDIMGSVALSPYGFIYGPSVAQQLGIYEESQESLAWSWKAALKVRFPYTPIMPWDATLLLSQDRRETRDTRTGVGLSSGFEPGDAGRFEPGIFLVDNPAQIESMVDDDENDIDGEIQFGGGVEYTIPGGALSLEANVSGIFDTPNGDIPVGRGQIWFRPFNLPF